MNPLTRIPSLALLIACCGCSALSTRSGAVGADGKFEENVVYSIGWKLGRQLGDYHLTPAEADLLAAGVRDGVDGREPRTALVSDQQALFLEKQRMAEAAAPERLASEAFVAAEAKRLGVEPAPSGLVFKEERAGSGANPVAAGTATVSYEIRNRDGALVASSGERADTFPLSSPGIPPCVREALIRMQVGGRSRFVCPPQLAYGDRRHGPLLPGGSALVVEAELIAVDEPLPEEGH